MSPNRCDFGNESIEPQPERPSAQHEASEAWLRDWFRGADAPDYERAMEMFAAIMDGKTEEISLDSYGYRYGWRFDDYGHDEKYITTVGSDSHESIPAELWWHVSIVLGREVPERFRASSFSCSC